MKRLKFTDFLVGIVFTLLFISLAVVITINFRPLYYWDIDFLHINTLSGYPAEEIRRNYDALIDYSSPFFPGKLSFPTLTASPNGLQHFAETKNVFVFFYILAFITLIIGVGIIVYKQRKNEFRYLLATSITAIVIPPLVGLLLFIDFDSTFIFFHKLVFSNDYWLFDPITDPVILILPETFFLHCALMILLLVLLASAAFFLVYLRKKKYFSIKYRKIDCLKL